MDIGLKRSRPFRIWLYLFIGIYIVVFCLTMASRGRYQVNYLGTDIISLDYRDTQQFKDFLGEKFHFLAEYITHDWDYDYEGDLAKVGDSYYTYDYDENMDENERKAMERIQAERDFRDYVDWQLRSFRAEGQNLIYYAANPKTDVSLTNSATDLGITNDQPLTLPKGYDFYIHYDGQRFLVQNAGKPLDIYESNNGYWSTQFYNYIGGDWDVKGIHQDVPDIRGCQILLAVKKDLVTVPYEYSILYSMEKNLTKQKYLYLALLLAFTAELGLFIFSLLNRNLGRELERTIGGVLGKVLLEFKILFILVVWIISMYLVEGHYWAGFLKLFYIASVLLWLTYFAFIDIRANREYILTKNMTWKLVKWYWHLEGVRPFHKAQLIRIRIMIILEALFIFFSILLVLLAAAESEIVFFVMALILVCVGIFLFYLYTRRFANNLVDIDRIIEQTERIRKGDIGTKLEISPGSDLKVLEENLNTIQEGMATAVENSIKSERMKVELITNISHDLKTPLTSIISYVDLLSKESDLPEHVRDYIGILAQKSDRLKFLIQDLFDLSKVASGQMEFDMKTLDLVKLIQQTLADLEDRIQESGLGLRLNLPDEPVFITSDGNKLYRVFANLFSNALKYSLIGTRVYVDLTVEEGRALVEIKNTANYEMNFSEEEITERFFRGDKARTSEGSGLGLAIAQNFTQSCGGDFEIKVDGDLFKAILSFNTI